MAQVSWWLSALVGRRDRGQGMTEYALVLSLIVVASAGAALTFGSALGSYFSASVAWVTAAL